MPSNIFQSQIKIARDDDKIRLKKFNVFPNEQEEFATLRPPVKDGETPDPEWGTKILEGSGNDIGYKEYCQLNPHTLHGALAVATYGGYVEDFKKRCVDFLGEDYEQNHDAEELYRVLVEVYALNHETRKVTLEYMEGLHRISADLECYIGSPINNDTGDIDLNVRLSTADFDCLLRVNDGKPPPKVALDKCIGNKEDCDDAVFTDSVFQAWVTLSRTTTDDKKSFFNERDIPIKVLYVHDFDIPVQTITLSAVAISQSISDNKHNSSRKDVGTQVAEEMFKLIRGMSEEALSLQVNLDDFTWDRGYPAKNGGDKDKDGNFPTCSYLNTGAVENYATDPFSEQHRQAVIKLFTAPAIIDETKMVQPPFLPSFKSLVLTAKKKPTTNKVTPIKTTKKKPTTDKVTPQVMTTDMVNKILFGFPIIHIYQAGTTTKDEETRKGLCMYYALFNLHESGMAMIKPHKDGLKNLDLLNARSHSSLVGTHDVLTAAMWTVEHVLAKLMTMANWNDDSIGTVPKDVLLERRNKVADEVSTTLSALTRNTNSDNSDFIKTTSKFTLNELSLFVVLTFLTLCLNSLNTF